MLGGGGEWIAGEVNIQERGEALFLVFFRHLQKGAEVADFVVLQHQGVEAGQAFERREVGNRIVVERYGEEAGQAVDPRDGSNLIVVQVEGGQAGKFKDVRDVGALGWGVVG